ncbi:lysozyme [Haloechinothrix alba]|uniref:lysozyme n=1 Tax=Haloechinothrix alba TaxID=664784 RepID=UPI003CCC0AA6
MPQRAVPPVANADTGGATVESGRDESEPAPAPPREEPSGDETADDDGAEEATTEEETTEEQPDIADQLADAADTVVELVKGDDSVVQHGIDVSGWQGRVDWQHWWDEGKRFAYIKATEGTDITNSDFAHQYAGARDVGMIRGAYHYALPNESSGAAQANFFVDNGGAWSADGQTLPGVLDIEFNPYGPTCFGMTESAMVSWIEDFHDTYHERTGRYPVFYTNTKWWKRCVGTRHGFDETVPLWIARYADDAGELPPGWGEYTIWQYTDSPLDKNEFNGSYRELVELARGGLLE